MDRTKFKDTVLGGFTSNPVFVLVIGMCPVIAQSDTLAKAFALGVCTAVVLIVSNMVISSIRNLIPTGVRIPAYITIIATITTAMILFVQSYMYDMYDTIGPFLSLVAVNCIVMGRVEAFASKNNPLETFVDSTSISLGFVGGISLLGAVRQILTKMGFEVFGTVAGGFMALGCLIVVYNFIYNIIKKHIADRQKIIDDLKSQVESLTKKLAEAENKVAQ